MDRVLDAAVLVLAVLWAVTGADWLMLRCGDPAETRCITLPVNAMTMSQHHKSCNQSTSQQMNVST